MKVCIDQQKQMMLMLKRLDRHVTQIFEQRTAVSLTRYEILVAISEHEPVTQKALQQCLAIDQAAITRHVKLLEQQGFIRRERNAHNNREVLVTLCVEGRALLEGCSTCKDEFLHNLYDDFSNEELQQLQQFLLRLHQNVKKL